MPHHHVIAALEAGVGGAQEVARKLVAPMEGVDKSPLVQVLRAAGDLTPEQITIISAKVTADWIKFEALSTVGAYVSRADVLGKVRDVAQRVEKGTLTVDQAKQMLISDGIVFEARAAESGAASAAESTVQKCSAQKIKSGSKGANSGVSKPREGAAVGGLDVIKTESLSHSFENVEQLIANAGKLKRVKRAKQGWIKGNPEVIFKNLADKYGAQIKVKPGNISYFEIDKILVCLTGSKSGTPTLRVNIAEKAFKIRVI